MILKLQLPLRQANIPAKEFPQISRNFGCSSQPSCKDSEQIPIICFRRAHRPIRLLLPYAGAAGGGPERAIFRHLNLCSRSLGFRSF
jgi:hypothetical protein